MVEPTAGQEPRERTPRGTARERLLDAAEGLFAERGFTATTTRAITERAGTSAGAIFYHFESKEALLEACLRERRAKTHFEAVLGRHPDDPRAGLMAVAAHLVEAIQSQRTVFMLAIRGEGPISGALLEGQLVESLDTISGYLVDTVGGGLSGDQARTMASMLVMSVGLTELLLPASDPEAHAAEVVDVLLHSWV